MRTHKPIVYLRRFVGNDDALPFVASTVRGGETDMSDLMNAHKRTERSWVRRLIERERACKIMLSPGKAMTTAQQRQR